MIRSRIRDDVRGLARTLDAPVPAQVVVVAVTVVLAIGLVVLVLVAHEVVQSKAVVTGDEVDARLRRALARLEDVAAARQARGERADLAGVTPPESPHRIAV